MPRFRIALMCFAFLLVTSLAFAGEVDVLINKLVEKGILTEGEAKTILSETKESVKKQLEAGKLDSVPAWAQATKFSGDLRLRLENRDFAGYDDKKTRSRIRFRYGFEAKVNPQIKVGARVATGSSQLQSARNQNMENAFETKKIQLDLAYLEYNPIKSLKLIGGKFSNPFYTTSELVWAVEVNPEGGALKYAKTIKPAGYPANIDLFANVGVFALDSSSTGNISPVIYGAQLGAATNVFDRKLKTAVAYYDFADLKGALYTDIMPVANSSGLAIPTNTQSSSKFVYDYRVIDVDAEYPILDIELLGQVLPLGIYGNYVKNVAEEVKKDAAWLVGFKLGKTKDPKSWSFSYDYRRVARDATLDMINDVVFHNGGTNSKGHKFSLSYVALKNTTLSINYFKTKKVQGIKTLGEELDRLQLQCLVSF